jgi:hypothetical protein
MLRKAENKSVVAAPAEVKDHKTPHLAPSGTETWVLNNSVPVTRRIDVASTDYLRDK